ncbi:histidine phosphatase family protein [Nonomuraea rhizosphaerae]|uniref:histidine phosphatase family protein n=1 Tax=Nonomuraea rhizosphaerae TaxID=2665663 RepID=UPI001C60634A|nr:histidine phosphatase family protein [Nonomuraea rhizosphaerae]
MGPSRIIATRHGESEGNAAYREAGDKPLIYDRQGEVTLTALGRTQAQALGRLLAALPEDEAPELAWCSPYRRAQDTWAVASREWRTLPTTVDPRLRDREMGRLSRHNWAAVGERFPDELARWRAEGDYFYRPPGGESFGDVAGRLTSFVEDLREQADGRRVLIVAHDAVVLVLRHVLDALPDISDLEEFAPIHNASVSTWQASNDRLELLSFNDTAHL